MRKDLKSNIKSRVGEKRIMKCGEEAEIVEYRSTRCVTVRFLKTGELVRCQYNDFKIGNIKSHFTPTVYGVGIVGREKTKDENNKVLKSYKVWQSMLQRCYDGKLKARHPTYKKCLVCDEWLYYPSFKKWYEENYYEIEGQRIHLDKDILIKGNKIYSPDNCIFVPHDINVLFTKCNSSRGELPIGVVWLEKNKKYQAYCGVTNIVTGKSSRKALGLYNTPEKAFGAYKNFKEENIKQVADYYKDKIPKKLYEAMYKYEVEITD